MSSVLQELKKFGTDYSILYIEDNEGLRTNVKNLLEKVFARVFAAENGKVGFEMFKKHHPDIIITDINMPEMNGLEMAEKIHDISPSSKLLIMSAHEEKEYLHQAINAGVFRFLNKPAKTDILMKTLYDVIIVLQREEDNILLQVQLQDIFNYQNNIIIMLKNGVPTLVNHRFLDFFDVESIEEFFQKGHTLESLLQEHSDFLFTTKEKSWYETVCENPGKLFHTKIKNHQNENRHLILKARKIPNKKDHFVLSFDDVTELNLMKLFDKDSAEGDIALQDKQAVIKMMKIVLDNSAEVKVHNFYRGLTITNPAVVTKVDDNLTVLKTSYSQLNIVQLIRNTVLSSDVFPTPILIKTIDKVDFDQQTISFSQMQFLARSATDRKNIRLEPDENSKVSLFFNDRKFTTENKIIDISITSIKIEVGALPPGVEKDVVLDLAIVLPTDSPQPLVINTSAKLFRIDEHTRSYDLILAYELHEQSLEKLKTYMVRRQMTLIREFKSLELKM